MYMSEFRHIAIAFKLHINSFGDREGFTAEKRKNRRNLS